MDLKKLHEFVVLSQCLNFSKAAGQLYLTQSVLSRHIHDLEQQVGAKLLIRSTHNVELTEIGNIFLKDCETILHQYDAALERIRTASMGLSGNLLAGFSTYGDKHILSKFTLYFSRIHPNIQLNINAYEAEELASALINDKLDMGFAMDITKDDFNDFETILLYRDPLYVFFPDSHPFATRNSLCIHDLSSQPIIALGAKTNPKTDLLHRKLFSQYNSEYKVAKEAPNIQSALFLVTLNQGLLILPEHVVPFTPSSLIKKRLCDEDCYVDTKLVYKRSGTNPAVSLFYDAFLEFKRTEGDNQENERAVTV